MAASFSTTLAASGIFPIVSPNPYDMGPDGWQLSFQPVAFGGYVVLAQDQNSEGSIVTQTAANLTAVPWIDANGITIAAGTPISFTTDATAKIVAIVSGPSIYRLYAITTWYAGLVNVFGNPYTAPDTRGQTALWSGITVDSIPSFWDDNFEIVLAAQDAGGLTDA